MACNQSEFFGLFFGELERRGIEYVILHSYQEYPEKIPSDIDYAVAQEHLAKLPMIQAEVARKHGWALVQTLQHGVFAYYSVLVNLEDPDENLRLDACSSYARIRRLLVPEKILLAKRVRLRSFYIPAPSSEFIYILAKMFDAKKKSPANYLARLQELWSQDKATAQRYFTDLFGDTGKSLEQWFETPAEEWRKLGPIMFARNRFGPGLLAQEVLRLVKRVFRPTGVCLAVIGSEGAGKSTLVEKLQTMLQPCFRYHPLHFRPGGFNQVTTGAITDTHGRAPRNKALSWLRVAYYFADNWMAWWMVVLPARIRSHLVIFDRSFDDLLVDPRRYQLKGTNRLVRLLRRCLPGADRTFVLVARAEVLLSRKPGLPVEELAKQQEVLRGLVGKRYTLVDAEESAEAVVRKVWRVVVVDMAEREGRRV